MFDTDARHLCECRYCALLSAAFFNYAASIVAVVLFFVYYTTVRGGRLLCNVATVTEGDDYVPVTNYT